jgi:hypothetical protein
MLVYQNGNYNTIELTNYEDFTRELNNAINYGPCIHVSVFYKYKKIDLKTVKNMAIEEINTLILVNDLDIIENSLITSRYRNNEFILYFLPARDITEYEFLPTENKFRLDNIKPSITNTNELRNKSLYYDIIKRELIIN